MTASYKSKVSQHLHKGLPQPCNVVNADMHFVSVSKAQQLRRKLFFLAIIGHRKLESVAHVLRFGGADQGFGK